MTQQTTTTYSVNAIDADNWPAAFRAPGVLSVTPGAQDSGRCRFAVTVAADAQTGFEAALNADDAVIEYSVVE